MYVRNWPAQGNGRQRSLIGMFLTVFLLGCIAASAQPANDNFANAEIVSGTSGSVTGSSLSATKETGEPNHADNAGGHSIWYQWTAPSAGTFAFSTAGSNFDTVMAVYAGSAVNSLTTMAYNDDNGVSGSTSRAVLRATSGVTYYVAVDGFNGVSGSVDLAWDIVPAPANDDFANAQTLSGAKGAVTGNNEAANAETGEPVHAGAAAGRSVWYRWTASVSGTIAFGTQGSDFDTVLAVYSGAAVNSLSPISSNNDEGKFKTSFLTFSAVAGTTYSIAVDTTFMASLGNISLSWGVQPANDNFVNAQAIHGTSGQVSGSNFMATHETGESSPFSPFSSGRSVWYQWTANRSGTVAFSTAYSDFDTTIAVYNGANAATMTFVGSDDDSGPNKTSWLSFNAVAGTTYSIAVDGYDGPSGNVLLTWIQGGSDFGKDAQPDMLIYNASLRQVAVMHVVSGNFSSYQVIKTLPVGFQVVGVGDFNGDGIPDVVLANPTTRQVSVGIFNGSTIVSYQLIKVLPANWQVAAVGDFNNDGKPDLILQNLVNHQVSIGIMNGTTLVSYQYIKTLPTAWRVAAVGDFNADGQLDLLLTNPTNHQMAIGWSNGSTVTSYQYVKTLPVGWNIVGIGDFDASSGPDIVLTNPTTRQVSVAYMSGATLLNYWQVRTLPAGWQAVGPR